MTRSRENDDVNGLPTHTVIRASHFEFQQAFCSGRVRKRGSLWIPSPYFSDVKGPRPHEAILLILDVAAMYIPGLFLAGDSFSSLFRRFFFAFAAVSSLFMLAEL